MTAATRTGARAKATKAPARPKAAKTTQAPKPLTPYQAWAADPEAAIASLCEFVTSGGHMADYSRERGLNYTSVLKFVNATEERRELYAQAREERADKLADEIVAIADEVEVAVRHEGEDVRLAVDAAAIARNRLRVDARKWVAAKLKPRTYGEKTTTEHTGANGGAIQHSIGLRFVDGEPSTALTPRFTDPSARSAKAE